MRFTLLLPIPLLFLVRGQPVRDLDRDLESPVQPAEAGLQPALETLVPFDTEIPRD